MEHPRVGSVTGGLIEKARCPFASAAANGRGAARSLPTVFAVSFHAPGGRGPLGRIVAAPNERPLANDCGEALVGISDNASQLFRKERVRGSTALDVAVKFATVF